MAARVLTDQERESLKSHAGYKYQAEWAARNYGAFWAVNDGASATTEALRIKWAKDRICGVDVIQADLNDPDISIKFLKLGKGIQVDIGAAPVPADDIVTALLAANKFEEMSSMYFDMKGEGINMNATGN